MRGITDRKRAGFGQVFPWRDAGIDPVVAFVGLERYRQSTGAIARLKIRFRHPATG